MRVLTGLLIAAMFMLLLTGCMVPNAPETYRGDECEFAQEIMNEWAGTGDEYWAVDTAMRESRCQPHAYNPSGASGIFQLMMPLHSRFVFDVCGWHGVFEPECNIEAARQMYEGQGRRPWNF